MRKTAFLVRIVTLLLCLLLPVTAIAAGTINSIYKFGWSENGGWVNFNPTNGAVFVYDDHLEGYAWSESIGLIKLGSHSGGGVYTYGNTTAANWGVNLTINSLSGFGWSENAGWIKFNPTGSGVTLNAATGAFDGYAWSESLGWIHLKGSVYNVRRLLDQAISFTTVPVLAVGGSGTIVATTASGLIPVFSSSTVSACTATTSRIELTNASASRQWRGIAASANGTLLVAAAWGDYLYTSIDSGATWTSHVTDTTRNWYLAASSADGQMLAAAVYNGPLYSSSDAGTTWTLRSSAGNRQWSSLVSSADGVKLAAAATADGNVYTSADAGATWTAHAKGGAVWKSLSSSADGTKLVLATQVGSIYYSIDSGATWALSSAATGTWGAVASSQDGERLIVCNARDLYQSINHGATWSKVGPTPATNWMSVGSSADGSHLVAAATNGLLYTSDDFGATWRSSGVATAWEGSVLSSDGGRLTAAADYGTIHTYADNTMVRALKAGLCTINANQSGSILYSAASQTVQSFVISKATATVTLGNLSQNYNGTARTATATTAPTGLAVTVTYNGSLSAPISIGTYSVVGTVNDANYQGSAAGALAILGNILTINKSGMGTVIASGCGLTWNGNTGTCLQTSSSVSFTLTPDAGYYATASGSCNGSLNGGTSYVIGSATADCGLQITFLQSSLAPVVSGTSPTKNARPTWTWTSGGAGGNGTYRYHLDSAGWTTSAALSSQPATSLEDGSRTLFVQEQDAAGNWSSSGYKTIVIDTSIAPLVPAALPQSGQTTTYYSGDDGSLRTGVPWPSPRFTVLSSGSGTIVSDNLSGLVWPQDGGTPTVGSCTGGLLTWQGALDYVACLNTSVYLGYTDWRLPNFIELNSLVNVSQSNMATWLNTQGFANVADSTYWSSTRLASTAGSFAWELQMLNSSVDGGGVSNTTRVLPVRGGQGGAVSLPRTGQTTMYATGDDGDLQQGIVWPEPRFANADGTAPVAGDVVVDQLTGLMWTRNGAPGGYATWQGALDYIAGLNSSSYLGYKDWRLPNRNELLSLLNYGQAQPADWLNTQGFTNALGDFYWSSTTSAGGAWVVVMYGGGGMWAGDKGMSNVVWPVRGGQSGSFSYLTVSKTGAGLGTVSIDRGALLWSGSTGTVTIDSQTAVTLTASPNSGSEFSGWSGACSGLATSCTVTMDMTTKTVNADFINLNQYTVTATAGSNGTINPGSRLVTHGSTTTFTIAVDPGYSVISVTGCNGSLNLNTYNTGAIISNCTVTATFADITKPNSPSVSGPASPTNDPTPTWTWTSGGGGGNGTYRRKLDSGAWVTTTETAFTPASALDSGSHTILVQEMDDAANWSLAGSSIIEIDLIGPALNLSMLPDGAVTGNWVLNITGTVVDPNGVSSVSIEVNSEPTGTVGAVFNIAAQLQAGANTIVITATDTFGNQTIDTRTITYDRLAPKLTVTTPSDNSTTSENIIELTGTTAAGTDVNISMNNGALQPVTVSSQTFTAAGLNLSAGVNTIEVIATNATGSTNSLKRTVLSDSLGATLNITQPAEDSAIMKNSLLLKGTVANAIGNETISILAHGQTYTALLTNGTFTKTVTFPTEGNYSIVVTVKDNSGNTLSTVQRNIIYYTIVSPTALNFGNQLVSSTSTTRIVIVHNTGEAPLIITSISIAGTNPGQFTQASACPMNGAGLASGATCTINVRFKPTTSGAKTASLAINVADPAASQLVALSGAGIAPVALVSKTAMSFVDQLINTTSTAQTVTVTNSGTAPLYITGINLTGTNSTDFSRTTTCPTSTGLKAKATCSISVKLKPLTTGVKNATLQIVVLGPANTKTLALSGKCVAPVLLVSKTTISFGSLLVSNVSTTRAVIVSNTGDAPLFITSINLNGANPGQFSQATTCSTGTTGLASGATCTINVRFKPTTTGAKKASIVINVATPALPKTITLTGSGT